jgi:hypothetical protein
MQGLKLSGAWHVCVLAAAATVLLKQAERRPHECFRQLLVAVIVADIPGAVTQPHAIGSGGAKR